ncbi:MAG: pyruvate, water dikinase [Deltaproteobacteria bacterium]|nr:pyruvate, water dikinase [Deltaproteobacteria bacterium]
MSILGIQEIADEEVGGKAKGLAELTQMGLPVPPAFVIQHANADDLPLDLEAHYKAIGGGLVAVRSSAIGEDGVDASFAGQYETVLNVKGIESVRLAIKQCIASLDSARAQAYKSEQTDVGTVEMCVVVQRMVNARAAGVLFTADPVTGRHDRLVIDAVEGLGEALVSGEATPDHFALDRKNDIAFRDVVHESQVLSDEEIRALAQGAREASEEIGNHLDMEWAIDKDGSLYWLQARPITTLSSDLNEIDTPIPDDHVITRCNVGEMMPGAVCPLTFTTQGRAIEEGMQHMQVEYGGRKAVTEDWTQMNLFYGHWFINLTEGIVSSRYVSVNTAETIAQGICGRSVPELKEPDGKKSYLRRLWGTMQFFRYCAKAPKVLAEFEQRFNFMHVCYTDDSVSMERELFGKFRWLVEGSETQLRTTAGAAVMEGILQGIISKGEQPPTPEQQAEVVKLLAGTEYVESAMLVDHFDEVLDLIALHPQAKEKFQEVEPAEALAWLQREDTGAAPICFKNFLERHGHRGYRELCLREKAWADDPEKLIVTMQASIAARFVGGSHPMQHKHVKINTLPWLLRKVLPITQNAIRRREHNKSILVEITHRMKCGYRYLGDLLVKEGKLPDADLVFFFARNELEDFVTKPTPEKVAHAIDRRKALAFHEKMDFDEISVGKPEPVVWQPSASENEGELVGRPVSRGVVEGLARVAMTVQEAAALQPGEILIAPITDVGWTPYFSLIAGLATDVGSAVSHGAVIAREYGLPAIVNLKAATKVFKTGDRVRLDADKGLLVRLDDES